MIPERALPPRLSNYASLPLKKESGALQMSVAFEAHRFWLCGETVSVYGFWV